MKHKRLATAAGAAVVAGTCALGVVVAEAHHQPRRPTPAQIEFARQTSDLMTNTVVAALIQEINETTPDNVQQGNLSIGLIFNDRNRDMRLVGTLQPLSHNDRPSDEWERRALAQAMNGVAVADVDRDEGRWYYRRSVPLSNFQPQCAMCHANFSGLPSTAFVGALMLRIPIGGEDD